MGNVYLHIFMKIELKRRSSAGEDNTALAFYDF